MAVEADEEVLRRHGMRRSGVELREDLASSRNMLMVRATVVIFLRVWRAVSESRNQ